MVTCRVDAGLIRGFWGRNLPKIALHKGVCDEI